MNHMQRAKQGGFEASVAQAEGRYRFTEYCIVPDQEYDVTGTCVENPGAKDEHDRNLIKKGTNEPTFVISYRTEVAIESELRNRAVKYIFGGALVSVICLAVLFWRFGWL
jgi:hypothetical protein